MIDLERLRIGITGGRGFLGNRFSELALKSHHWVHWFSRTPDTQHPACTEIRKFDLNTPPNVKGLNAIVHLAGENVFGLWTERKKRAIRDSRVRGTRLLVDSLIEARKEDPGFAPSVLIAASATGFYGDGGETILTERSPAGDGFLAEVTRAWEEESRRAETAGIRVVILRFGILIGEAGGMIAKMRPFLLAGLGARLGEEQWIPWLHIEDAARLILFCIQKPRIHGIINAVAPEPLRSREFYDAIAKHYGRKIHITIPKEWVTQFGGEFGRQITLSQRVISEVIPTLGFEYAHPTLPT